MNKTSVGIVGCGNISPIYFENLCRRFAHTEVKACADLNLERVRARVANYPEVKAMTVDDLMADPEIEIIVNLTLPQAHFDVAMQAVRAGKNVHGEKPLTLTREDGRALLAAARGKGVRVGAAPDTFLGGGLQTCRKLIDDGWIGEPIGAQACLFCHGHESWHPDPEFYYKAGGGPMFDMGPYYLTALVSLLGPVKSVMGSTRITFPERTITSKKKYGQKVHVDVPTHVLGIMNFESGAIGSISTSFDVWGSEAPRLEIFGSEATLSVPDPNNFGGPVRIRQRNQKEWQVIPLTHGYTDKSRGIGVADMAAAIRNNRPHRASGELAYHVLDLMHAFHEGSDQGRRVKVDSHCERPAAMPMGLDERLLGDQ